MSPLVSPDSYGKTVHATAEFTRENNATPYTAGDVISSSAGTPVVLEIPNAFRQVGGSGYLVSARVVFNVKNVIPRLRLHCFRGAPGTIAGDNLPLIEKYADGSKRAGYIDLPAMITAADGTNSDVSRSINVTDRLPLVADPASSSLFVLLETLDAVTLTALSKVTIVLVVENN